MEMETAELVPGKTYAVQFSKEFNPPSQEYYDAVEAQLNEVSEVVGCRFVIMYPGVEFAKTCGEDDVHN
jgi:hypothetical protein